MKTDRFEFISKLIEFCSENGCTLEYDEKPNTHTLEFIQINKQIGNNNEWFGIYLHKKYVEFWINDHNKEESTRYIYKCDEIKCMRYIQETVAYGYEYIITNYKNYTDMI